MAQQSIITKVLPATNTLPKRIRASLSSGLSVTITYGDGSLTDREVEEKVVNCLLDKVQWYCAGVRLQAVHLIQGSLNLQGDKVWVVPDPLRDLRIMRESGAAICVFQASELNGQRVKDVIDTMSIAGNQLIDGGC